MGNESLNEGQALVFRLYKKFPHLFKKTPNPQNPRFFALSPSGTRDKIKEAFELMNSRGDHSDLDGFKKVFSLYFSDGSGETATKFDAVADPVSGISDGFEDAIVTELITTLTEPTTKIDTIFTGDKKKGSVMFYFGDDYGNRREYVESVKEVISGYASHLTIRSRAFKRCKLSPLDEMLKEFAKENLF